MDRSRLASGTVAAVLGAVLGFLALFMREMGLALAAVTLMGLIIFFVRSGRSDDVGWVLLAAGLAPALILGRNAITTLIDPAVEVGGDTWLLLAAFALVASAGAIVAISRRISGTKA